MKLGEIFLPQSYWGFCQWTFHSASTIQARELHGHVSSGNQCSRADRLVSFHVYTAVNTTTIDFSHNRANGIRSDRRGKQIAALSGAAGWGAAGCDGVRWYPAIHSFIHRLWRVGIKAGTSVLSAHVKSIMTNQQVPSWRLPVWRRMCVCMCVSSSSWDLRNSARVLNKQIVDLWPNALLSAYFIRSKHNLWILSAAVDPSGETSCYRLIYEVTKEGEDVKVGVLWVYVKGAGARSLICSVSFLLLKDHTLCLFTAHHVEQHWAFCKPCCSTYSSRHPLVPILFFVFFC